MESLLWDEHSQPVEEWPAPDAEFLARLLRQERLPPVECTDMRERGLCVQWIVRACGDYGFLKATGALAVKYFDVFLLNCRAERDCDQMPFKELIRKVAGHIVDLSQHKESALCELICIICISIAAKKVEVKSKAPFLGEFDENFTFKQLRSMEQLILNKLKWNLSFSTAYDFIALWMPHVHSEINPRAFMTLSEEAVGVCIKGAEFFKCRPSVLAAGVAMWVHAALEQPAVQFETAVAQDLGEETMSSRDEDEVGSMCIEACLEEVSEQLRHRYPAVYERLRNERQESPGSIMAVGPMMFVPKPSCKGPMKKPVPHKNGAPATPDQPVETFSAMGRSPPASLADFAAKRTRV